MIKNFIDKRYLLVSLFAITLSCVIASIGNVSVYARAEESWSGTYGEITKKANMTGVVRCYNGGKMVKTIGNISEFKQISDITTDDDNRNYIALPSGLTNIGDDAVSCAELYKQGSYGTGGSFKGVFALAGKPEYSGGISGDETKATLLTNMGYVQSNNNRNCIQYKYKLKTTGLERTTRTLCLEDGKLDLQGSSNMGSPAALSFSVSNTKLTISGTGYTNYSGQPIPTTIDYSQYPSWTLFVSEINSILAEKYNPLSISEYGTNYTYDLVTEPNANDISGSAFTLSNQKVSYMEALKFIAGYESYNDLMFSKSEQLQYFIGVLRSFYNVDVVCDKDPSFLPGYTPIKIDISGGTLRKSDSCYVKPQENTDKKAHGFTNSSDPNYKLFDANGSNGLSFTGVINEINKLAEDMTEDELSGVSTSGAASAVEDPCLDSQVADNLGWIICPIMNMAQDASEGLYKDFVEPALSIEPQLFSENGNINQGPTHDAWTVFQGFANIGFTALFLVVIFSQLTGVGIDNYGIKKILPKLIVTAVLVNLSYIICVICVDLSNILGNSLQDMFTSITINTTKTAYGIGSLSSTVFTAVPIAAGIIAAWYLITPAILLGLLISVIGLIISLLFLFLLLAGREAAIVVLTVISPLAFLCYMLPNTKKLFDKWLKIWEGLLLVYPIAGLLMGGGNFVSRLLVAINGTSESDMKNLTDSTSGGSFFTAFAAMMISIVPVFFIPTVLKGAFSALGNIGGKIAGFGSALSGKATGAVRKSDAFKDAQKRSKEWQTARRAGIGADGKPIDLNNMSLRQRLRSGVGLTSGSLSRNRAAYIANQKAKNNLDKFSDDSFFEGAIATMEDKQRDEAIDQQLALMKRNGINGQAYSVDNMEARIKALSEQSSFSPEDKMELASLSRGLADEKGGGGVLSKTIRTANKRGINSSFMTTMGEIYAKDSKVRSKLNEKDVAASVFTEQFLPHSDKSNQPQGNFQQFRTDKEHHDEIGKRIKTYEQGLGQSGDAMNEYVNEYLTDADIQRIYDDKSKMSGLETDAIRAINSKAEAIVNNNPAPTPGPTGQSNRAKAKPISAEDIPKGTIIIRGDGRRGRRK